MTRVVMGTFKWVVRYYSPNYRAHTHTIPGRNIDLQLIMRVRVSGGAGKNPDPEHPLWVKFVEVFRKIRVSEQGYPISKEVDLGFTGANWPPRGAKRR